MKHGCRKTAFIRKVGKKENRKRTGYEEGLMTGNRNLNRRKLREQGQVELGTNMKTAKEHNERRGKREVNLTVEWSVIKCRCWRRSPLVE
jgi:hypothetical protein